MSPPVQNNVNNKSTEPVKSWKKINEERKALKKQRKQEKLLKTLEKANKIEELTNTVKSVEAAPKQNPSTVSIAVPGSILENAQSAELRSYVAGQIARAACIFRVNEVIVYDDVGLATVRETKRSYDVMPGEEDAGENAASQTVRGSSLQLGRILQYLECPQYLRKFFFPLHKDLKYSGLLNPLDAPHHLRQQNLFMYREGIVTDKKAKEGQSYVNVGLLNDVLIDKAITPGMRVTVKLNNLNEASRKLRGTAVSPDEPRRETGVYWGYTVRIAHSLSEIFTKSPYKDGYNLTVGTSDRGTNVREVPNSSYKFNHLLIVFGGLKGLETALANDDTLDVEDPELLFDHYLNVLPKQGSRTIRTEEAVLIAMAAIQEKLHPDVMDVEQSFQEFLPRSEDTGLTQPIPYDKKQNKRKYGESNEPSGQGAEVFVNEHEFNKCAAVNDDVKSPKKNSQKKRKHTENSKPSAEISDTSTKSPIKSQMSAAEEVDDFEIVMGTSETQATVSERNLGDLSRFD